ncbi:SDR family NAD(P)-dependent oxidoreductase [Mycolicibacterium porcinum]|uniref:SDR family oxidoreductase n=1 Tax=Mycolicibacterium porcinum TaxID=39693 RepID=A0AAW5T1I3_9MYCO|nr:SDR family NAD(P)-dependent oxidoreductase [Mycolicibacterium porcinum]MCV7388093.1 SDR family oxidoreductase [Mycolicibacterium porcinum]ORB43383.1 short-chain dehydrogenase [Mycolicibacterium porcinum]CDO31222.1 short-chain dehydrogenase/reductase SDR [Mycolicibacterium vulneris]
MGRLDGKVAVVTGAGQGIGRGIARRFAAEGAAVVVAELDPTEGEQVAADIDSAGGRAVFIRTDVGDKAQIESAIVAAVEVFGRLDVLVNNAIALSPNVPLEDKSDEDLDGLLRTGLWATWWAMRSALPHFQANGGGRVINFYSIDAEAAAWLHADYNLTKEAIRGLTRSAAAEWGRYNVLVNAIAPAAKGTVFDQLSQAIPGFAEMSAAANPLGRVGDPETDIAPVAVFLASDDSRYVTGETIHVDGGQHLPRYNSKPPAL